MLGALIGAVLLLATPERVFELLIPLLLGFATVLFAFAGRITRWLRARARRAAAASGRSSVTSIPLLLPISVYGGYFGAGVGTLLLGVLIGRDRGRLSPRQCGEEPGVEPQHASPPRSWFIANGAVSWPQTLVMMAGCLIGGFCGAHLARVVPQEVDAGRGRGGRRGADRGVRLALLVLGSRSAPARRSRFVIALFGSVIGSQTVKWFMPGIAS